LASRYAGLVETREHPAGGLLLLNYTERCQYERAWDDVTVWCRGLIIDTRAWEVAALPLAKFFNVGERPESSIESLPQEPFAVYEKLDGSLGITYRLEGKLVLATRGAFTSREALQGTKYLQQLAQVDSIPESFTCLFEVICQHHRRVSSYDFEGLALLAVIDRRTGAELSWSEVQTWADRLGCRTPAAYPFGTLAEVLQSRSKLPAKMEGYVIRFASGLRVKAKGDAYLELQKRAAQLSEERILQELARGEIEPFLQQVPEEFRADVQSMISELKGRALALETQIRTSFQTAPNENNRKAFAAWVQSNVPSDRRSAFFQLYDGKTPNWYELLRKGQVSIGDQSQLG
jgi:RNA ligase